ncbi:MAG: uracil phosphoribosyltransferase [Cyanobacteria bacterium J06632_22]
MAMQLRVYVPPHPLIKHWLGVVRDAATPSAVFRNAMIEMGRWLTYEAAREWLPTVDVTIETPLAECPATFVNAEVPMVIIPILRAGLALMPGIESALPTASVYHLGFARDEETLEATCYVNKLPAQLPENTHVMISEPMLATGGTMMATMKELTERGVNPSLVRVISIVVSPVALKKLADAYPEITIYSAAIDESLDENGFIVPGLGDAGDRTFAT